MPKLPPLNPNLLKAGTFPFAAFEARKAALKAAGQQIFDFGVGDPVEPTPDFIRQALADGIPTVSQYPSPHGLLQLRDAISKYLSRRFGVSINSESEIMPSVGSKEAVFNITSLFGGANSKRNIIIAPQPGYFVVEKSAIMNSLEFYPYALTPTNQYLMDLASLPPALLNKTAIAWINYPHNPTGAICSLEYLKQQVATAHKYGFVLCSDETYCDIYDNIPPPSVLQAAKESVLAFHSCSKRSGMTAYRSGFVAGDAELIRRFVAYRNIIGAAPPVFTQQAALAAWSDDLHPAQRRACFAQKKDVLLGFFKERELEVYQGGATFYLWVKAPGAKAQPYAELLLEKGLVVSPGDFFGEANSDYFRVALAPSLEDCHRAVQVWKKI
ncbi:MAG: aminotransferase class I/II-fold pyridoxal phosphate-dependent enzyme [Deltaproteobacteria bacterium]|nr:aminotransferase class I/II-fold pyridoxal phosphate-dependent enzyme [Deltaproteobacteria bacterium]